MTAVSRGLNMSIAEGLQVEGEQFARLVPAERREANPDEGLGENLAAWMGRRRLRTDC
jgi:enoyl-CoA hydratase